MVSCYLISFIVSSKVDNEILPKVAECLMILLEDESIVVAKKVILSMSHFYNIIFKVCIREFWVQL